MYFNVEVYKMAFHGNSEKSCYCLDMRDFRETIGVSWQNILTFKEWWLKKETEGIGKARSSLTLLLWNEDTSLHQRKTLMYFNKAKSYDTIQNDRRIQVKRGLASVGPLEGDWFWEGNTGGFILVKSVHRGLILLFSRHRRVGIYTSLVSTSQCWEWIYSNYLKFPHSWEKLMGKRVFWKFAKNQVFVGRKRFLDRGFLYLRFITYIFWGFFRSWEGPFLIRCKSFRSVERASSKSYYFGFYLRNGK
jgi:hypothetical protein